MEPYTNFIAKLYADGRFTDAEVEELKGSIRGTPKTGMVDMSVIAAHRESSAKEMSCDMS
jgi:hypothetical protein